MGITARALVMHMDPEHREHMASLQETRLERAKHAGAAWAFGAVSEEGKPESIVRRAESDAEAWQWRQIQERCDAYADGLYD